MTRLQKLLVRKFPRRNHLILEQLEDRTLLSTAPASLVTDKPDYAPGETAVLSGSGFQVGEAINLVVVRTDGIPDYPPENQPWQVVDGGAGDLDGVVDGNFQTTWYVAEQYAGASLLATATGLTSDATAEYAFTDAATSVDITSPTNTNRSTVSSLPGTVRVTFNYSTSSENGSTTGVAKVTTASGTVIGASSKSLANTASGQTLTNFIDVTIPAGTADAVYTVTVTIQHTNPSGSQTNSKDDTEVSAVVVNASHPPTLQPIPAQTVDELTPLTFQAVASDVDLPNDALTFSLVGAPAGAAINSTTGAFSWTPAENQDGVYDFDVAVSDTQGHTVSQTVHTTVKEVNRAPTLSLTTPPYPAVKTTTVTFTASATDPDTVNPGAQPNTLTFSLLGAPVGATINAATGAFSWAPGLDDDGTFTFTVRVTDNGNPNLYDEQSVSITTRSAGVVDGVLYVVGHDNADDTLTTVTNGSTEAYVNGNSAGVFTGFSGIVFRAGNGSDTITVQGWTGPAVIEGGAGADTVVASQNADYSLGTTLLSSSDGLSAALDSIENVDLIGAGATAVTVSGWTGTSLALSGAGPVALSSVSAGSGGISIDAASITVNGPVSTTALGALTLNGSVLVTAGGSIVADGDLSFTHITATGNLPLTSTAGNITVGVIDAAGFTVTLTASGAILDGNGAGDNITADTLVMVAGAGIGSSADPLETVVSFINAQGGTGSILVTNSGGLIVTGASANGTIDIQAHSPLTIVGAVTSASGNVTLAAGDGGDLSIDASVSGGDVNLSAGGTLTIPQNILTATGTVAMSAASVVADLTGASLGNASFSSGIGGSSLNIAQASLGTTTFSGAGFAINATGASFDSAFFSGSSFNLDATGAAFSTFDVEANDFTLNASGAQFGSVLFNGSNLDLSATGMRITSNLDLESTGLKLSFLDLDATGLDADGTGFSAAKLDLDAIGFARVQAGTFTVNGSTSGLLDIEGTGMTLNLLDLDANGLAFISAGSLDTDATGLSANRLDLNATGFSAASLDLDSTGLRTNNMKLDLEGTGMRASNLDLAGTGFNLSFNALDADGTGLDLDGGGFAARSLDLDSTGFTTMHVGRLDLNGTGLDTDATGLDLEGTGFSVSLLDVESTGLDADGTGFQADRLDIGGTGFVFVKAGALDADGTGFVHVQKAQLDADGTGLQLTNQLDIDGGGLTFHTLDIDGTGLDADGTGLDFDGTGLKATQLDIAGTGFQLRVTQALDADGTGLDLDGGGFAARSLDLDSTGFTTMHVGRLDLNGTGLDTDATGLDLEGTGFSVSLLDVESTGLDADGTGFQADRLDIGGTGFVFVKAGALDADGTGFVHVQKAELDADGTGLQLTNQLDIDGGGLTFHTLDIDGTGLDADGTGLDFDGTGLKATQLDIAGTGFQLRVTQALDADGTGLDLDGGGLKANELDLESVGFMFIEAGGLNNVDDGGYILAQTATFDANGTATVTSQFEIAGTGLSLARFSLDDLTPNRLGVGALGLVADQLLFLGTHLDLNATGMQATYVNVDATDATIVLPQADVGVQAVFTGDGLSANLDQATLNNVYSSASHATISAVGASFNDMYNFATGTNSTIDVSGATFNSLTNQAENVTSIKADGAIFGRLVNEADNVSGISAMNADFDLISNTGDHVSGIMASGSTGSNALINYGSDVSGIDFSGGDGADAFINTGSDVSALFHGDGGDDSATIGGTNVTATLDGGTGNDAYTFFGAVQGTIAIGESSSDPGINSLDFSSFSSGITLDLARTTAQNVGGGLTLTLSNASGISNVTGTAYADTITGNDLSNYLAGSATPDDRITTVSGWNGRTQVVFLDFDTFTDLTPHTTNGVTFPAEHVYTSEERQGIQDRLEAIYHGPNADPNDPSTWWYRVWFVQAQPGETVAEATQRAIDLSTATGGNGVIAYEYFNHPRIEEDGSESPGGVSNEVDFRDLSLAGEVDVQANGLSPADQAPGGKFSDSESWILASATIAAHEVGHMMGLRHADAYGPIGYGIHNPPGADSYTPSYPGPATAFESTDHVIASPASVGSTIDDLFTVSYFGEREAVRLSMAFYAGAGDVVVSETSADHADTGSAQSLNLVGLYVPNTLGPGAINYGKKFDVAAVDVAASITDNAQVDVYSFQGRQGDLMNLEVISDGVLRPGLDVNHVLDARIEITDAAGNLIAYYTPGTASNQGEFESVDAQIIDLMLPQDGTYYITVTTLAAADGVSFSDVPASYELFVYRFKAVNATDGNDTFVASGGNDVINGGAGSDTILGNDVVTTWTVTGSNTGTLQGTGTSTFLNIENLTGGTGNDLFVLSNTGSLTGSINGREGIDTLDYSARTGAVTVILPLNQASSVTAGAFGIENVTGSQGNNILVGDDNANVLIAGTARSILIGGKGADVMTGSANDDIFVSGTSSHDTNPAALNVLLQEWTRTDLDYKARVADIMAGSSTGLNVLNGVPVVLHKGSANTGTVFDDASIDTLTGGTGTDLFFLSYSLDVIPDSVNSEKQVNLDNTAGNNKALIDATAGAADSGTSTLGAWADISHGPQFITIQMEDGSPVAPDLQARIDDVIAYWNSTFASLGTTLMEIATGNDAADFQISIGATSPVGGLADGVLGCTDADGTITLIEGWNWYTGGATDQIGSNQYDFETIALHEVGHALGLGHSTDAASVMFPELAAGQVKRTLTAQDFAVLDTDAGGEAHALHAIVPATASTTLRYLQSGSYLVNTAFAFGLDAARFAFSQALVATLFQGDASSAVDVPVGGAGYDILQGDGGDILVDGFGGQDQSELRADSLRGVGNSNHQRSAIDSLFAEWASATDDVATFLPETAGLVPRFGRTDW
jgi:Putative Ig domain/Matrixin/RTX calcium-binding nonapeptide repeat (4 copies)